MALIKAYNDLVSENLSQQNLHTSSQLHILQYLVLLLRRLSAKLYLSKVVHHRFSLSWCHAHQQLMLLIVILSSYQMISLGWCDDH